MEVSVSTYTSPMNKGYRTYTALSRLPAQLRPLVIREARSRGVEVDTLANAIADRYKAELLKEGIQSR